MPNKAVNKLIQKTFCETIYHLNKRKTKKQKRKTKYRMENKEDLSNDKI